MRPQSTIKSKVSHLPTPPSPHFLPHTSLYLQKLEATGVVYLKQALGMPESSALSAGSVSYTTTDVNAGLCITGVVKVGEKCGQQCGGSSP